MWSCYLPTCSSPILKHWKSYSVRANGRWVPQSIQIVGFMRSLVYLSTSITSVYAWTFCSHTLMIIHAVRSTFYKHTHTCTHIYTDRAKALLICVMAPLLTVGRTLRRQNRYKAPTVVQNCCSSFAIVSISDTIDGSNLAAYNCIIHQDTRAHTCTYVCTCNHSNPKVMSY